MDFSYNDYNYDTENGNGAFSFEDIGRREALKTTQALKDIDELLLAERIPTIDKADCDNTENILDNDELNFTHYRRYESNGYDAHSESVDQKEILSWQLGFSYLCVRGTGISIQKEKNSIINDDIYGDFYPVNATTNTNINTNDSSTEDIGVKIVNSSSSSSSVLKHEDINDATLCDLVIIGEKIKIATVNKDIDDNIDETNGIVDELIAINMIPNSHDNKLENEKSNNLDDFDPQNVRREEIVSLLLDAIWPEVVEILKPLIKKVINISKVNNIQYDDIKETQNKRNKQNMDDENNDMNVEEEYSSW